MVELFNSSILFIPMLAVRQLSGETSSLAQQRWSKEPILGPGSKSSAGSLSHLLHTQAPLSGAPSFLRERLQDIGRVILVSHLDGIEKY